MLLFPSKINNHADLSEHRSNVDDEGKERLDEKLLEWDKNIERWGRRSEKKNGMIRLRDGKGRRKGRISLKILEKF
ncbi:unnamed protein product [Trifolium pratense]|uniref:Uncharacterized protein n=1 Tax=Trifolium pratense TaxID=57577 RepID=A0ACB0L0F9_TRIPR|nr:unnamed protein product [Trifolium pratense]